MDVRYINPFILAVQNVFKTMLNVEVLVSKPLIKTKESPTSDVSAIIGLSGPVSGSVTLCFSKQVAVRVASTLAGTELSVYEPADLTDALGELTNMVAGQAKIQLPQSNITISLPRVILGDQHRLLESRTSPVLLLPCDSSIGRFSVEVTLLTKRFCPFTVEVDLGVKRRQQSV
ncbi:MAG TPA: chemotaxis protein CheX [Phycisphaerae bacterium]|nr:chemotaxis protein CheX [Phycisphaerae bacterium]HRR85264.1 chemotaxis protein CheX [Phycisphaerae bacterium]